MDSLLGRALTHYQVLDKLGSGGMGVVYKARDTRLNRLVAIKVLSPDRIADPARRARFIQEAQAASALNHPNIITIYEIDRDGDIDFIAMELVAGRTLDALIVPRGMKLGDLLKCAIQITDALAAAHAAGIIHRDLKPGNIMVTATGTVKVLDFGLAKLTESLDPDEEATGTIAQADSLTEQGSVLGTVAYMSPEQAEGHKVDARSDIFSFGSLLYEMVTGRRAFKGETRMSTLTAILRDDPKPIREAGQSVPRDLEKIVLRCLRRDVTRRFQHIDDVKVALEDLKEESDSGRAPVLEAPKRTLGKWIVLAGATALALIASAAWLWTRPQPAGPPELRRTLLTSYPGIEERPSLSPDGQQFAFSWNGEKQDNFDIYVKLIDSGIPLRLTSNPAHDGVPAWSPDGRQIAFIRNPGPTATVYLIPPLGGPERRLCSAKADSLAWTPDSKSLAIMDRGSDSDPYAIILVDAVSGEKRKLTSPPKEIVGDAPFAFSPDGQTLAFIRWVGPIAADLHLLSMNDGSVRPVTAERRGILGLGWMPGGKEIIFARNGLFRISATLGRDSRAVPLGVESGNFPSLVRTASGVRMAYERSARDINLWRMDLGGTARQIASSTVSDRNPQFSPDGTGLAFVSDRSRGSEIWVSNADGSSAAQVTSGSNGRAPRWSPDGQWIAFDARIPTGTLADIYVVKAEGGAPRRLTTWTSDEVRPSWSRDGRWIYFRSDRSGRNEIWRIPRQGGEAVQLTSKGGFEALESPDGKLLYFVKAGSAGGKVRNYEQAGTPGGLFRMPATGGEEIPVLAAVSHSFWDVIDHGIVFVDFSAAASPSSPKPIRVFRFDTRAVTQIGVLKKPLRPNDPGLSVTRDGRSLVWAQIDQTASDLMLVENLR